MPFEEKRRQAGEHLKRILKEGIQRRKTARKEENKIEKEQKDKQEEVEQDNTCSRK